MLKKFFNNQTKSTLIWIKEKGICQKITEFAFNNLRKVFKHFFSKGPEYLKFKIKVKNDSFTIKISGKLISIDGKGIKLPTIGVC